MMQALRENTKPIFIVTIAAFVGLMFIAWGADFQLGCDRQAPNAVAVVNGEAIPYQLFQDQFQAMYEQQFYGRQAPSELTRVRLLNQTYHQIIEDHLLRQEADRRKLGTRLEEVLKMLKTSPPPEIMQSPIFQTDGQFDFSKYYQALRTPQFLSQIAGHYTGQLPITKLRNEISWAAFASNAEAWEMRVAREQKATIAYIRVSPLAYGPDPASLDADAVRAYYDEHRADFAPEEVAIATYGRVDRIPSSMDTLEVTEIMETIFLELEAGESFDELMDAHSEADQGMRGGVTGRFLKRTATEIAPEMVAALDTLSMGDHTPPHRGPGGLHIVQLDSVRVESDGSKSYRLKDILMRVRVSGSTVSAIQDRIYRFWEIANKGDDLSNAAESTSVSVTTTDPVDLTSRRPYIPSVPVYEELLTFFKEMEPGEISPIYEAPNGWFVWRLDYHGPGTPPPLEEIEARVRSELAKSLGVDPARRMTDELMRRAGAGEDMEALAESDTLLYLAKDRSFVRYKRSIPGIGREPEIMGRIFAMEAGEIDGPFEDTDGNLYVVQLAAQDTLPSDQPGEDDPLRQNIIEMKRDEVMASFLQELREKGSITDYRNFRTGTF